MAKSGVSANLLYGFEQFILQSVQSGLIKVTFEREGQYNPFLSKPGQKIIGLRHFW
jgi:hypothetical protein